VAVRTTPRNPRRAAVEAPVLEATEALLAQGASYAELKIEQIASRAGISRPAFYFYFRDKRDLLMRLTADVADLLYAEAEAWWTGEGPGDLEPALRSVLALYQEHGMLLRAVVETAASDEEVAAFWRGLVARFVEATERRLQAERPDLEAHETAFALSWMTERTCYQHYVQGGRLDDDRLVRALVGIWTRAVYGEVERSSSRSPSA
jgi:TetR/AcrR family transcriptional regulator, ethionamide resistance regulator